MGQEQTRKKSKRTDPNIALYTGHLEPTTTSVKKTQDGGMTDFPFAKFPVQNWSSFELNEAKTLKRNNTTIYRGVQRNQYEDIA